MCSALTSASTRRRMSSASRRRTSRGNDTFRRTERCPRRAGSWKTIPTSRSPGVARVTSHPSIRITPLVRCSSPAIARSSVVFPLPDPPTTPTKSPVGDHQGDVVETQHAPGSQTDPGQLDGRHQCPTPRTQPSSRSMRATSATSATSGANSPASRSVASRSASHDRRRRSPAPRLARPPRHGRSAPARARPRRSPRLPDPQPARAARW